ncbi:hypothetical protein ABQF44_10350 [Mycolicibacterium porcinum]|uniref:Uncharacterized protein n=1 Tax=Mycolicibacterium porcinum TaxID=39693 RepID=A0AAW5TAM1_9MYCO|nr:hypothetical protein [Mycolicibacterium porcinum]MCV7391703.1 hypothetical protein [Mycolicibacterium porcinum]OCB44034.1 hypothetical protein A5721_21305 [Mycolicibacterium vulneris]ORB38515.1 hypothetical protein BST41_19145 [Mycolicibacterium porcinum]CDO33548.1 hypothetical protein BN979_06398 [Mycolicibacterium vulneris]
MSSAKYVWGVLPALAGLLTGALLIPAAAHADPEAPPQVEPLPDQQLHNVTYRARIDGVSRNATIAYKIDDQNINTADPSMLPGRIFEATGVVSNPETAGMAVRIDWPYSANLHCEILVDDQVVAQADTFVGPRLTRPKDDPNYGSLPCGAPLSNSVPVTVPDTVPPGADTAPPAPVDPAVPAPAEPAPPVT